MKHTIKYTISDGSVELEVEPCTDPNCYARCEDHIGWEDLENDNPDCEECVKLKALGCWVAIWNDTCGETLTYSFKASGEQEVEIYWDEEPVIDYGGKIMNKFTQLNEWRNEAEVQSLSGVLEKVIIEIGASETKFGNNHTNHYWLAVLTEEIGEVARTINDKERNERIEEELTQVAAVAIRWMEMLSVRQSKETKDDNE